MVHISTIKPGLYEALINRGLQRELDEASDAMYVERTNHVDGAESSLLLAERIGRVAKRVLDILGEQAGGQRDQVAATNALIAALEALAEEKVPHDRELADEMGDEAFDEPLSQLLSVVPRQNRIRPETLPRPDTSIAHTSLFTGSRDEPQMYTELGKEIASADRILMLVSFIKWPGLRLIKDPLEEFVGRGGQLRVVTTTYIGATDLKSVEYIARLPGSRVKVSYDSTHTRLHAKAYVFERDSGFTTAYVGSSNISNAALTSGLEWNVKLSRADQPDAIDKIEATFQTYWHAPEFRDFDAGSLEDRRRLIQALDRERHAFSEGGPGSSTARSSFDFDISPYPFQQQILDRLKAEREVNGRWRNLVVAATGTGKTIISAFDFRDFCDRYRDGRYQDVRFLYVAHREEILEQALSCYRGVFHDQNFGELYVGGHVPTQTRHLFVSIQTINSRGLCDVFAPDYFAYVVVDEFHHAAAGSYQKLLNHIRPKALLGLTATPERADGRSILGWFDGRIAAEIRLPEAIDRKLLCPFSYFGVSDCASLEDVQWSRGGYVASKLEDVYVRSEYVAKKRAHLIVDAVRRYLTDVSSARGLGFCVSKEHARFMAEQFNEHGIPSLCLTADSPDDERRRAHDMLVSRQVNFIFVVDLYNEGVDIPEVDTVLFLRPTESLTVFLQQLGRGLRLCKDKECLTVLDFIGQPNRRFDFESRFAAILEKTDKSMKQQIEEGFVSAPKGCYIQLERQAQTYVLDNVRHAYTSDLVDRIATFEADTGAPLTLGSFLDHYQIDPRRLYARGSFSRLCVEAGTRPDFAEVPDEDEDFAKGMARLATIDSRRWIGFLLDALNNVGDLLWDSLSPLHQRMLRMFHITMWHEGPDSQITEDVRCLAKNSTLLAETIELLKWRMGKIDVVDATVDMGFDCPLDLHCTYTRDQIMAAMDCPKPSTVRQGVWYAREKNVDVLLNTLNKTERDYSPSTMYQDYAIDESTFHWQSQNATSEQSPTGQRYVNGNSRVALFVRERKNEFGHAAPYTFLGLARCESHEGSRPMTIIWRLLEPIPAKFLPVAAKLAG